MNGGGIGGIGIGNGRLGNGDSCWKDDEGREWKHVDKVAASGGLWPFLDSTWHII